MKLKAALEHFMAPLVTVSFQSFLLAYSLAASRRLATAPAMAAAAFMHAGVATASGVSWRMKC